MDKINISYITYEGDKLPLRISWYALNNYQKETGKDINDIGEDIGNYEILLWYALIAGHHAIKKELAISREEVPFILDECLNEFINIYSKSSSTGEDSNDINDSNDKKN